MYICNQGAPLSKCITVAAAKNADTAQYQTIIKITSGPNTYGWDIYMKMKNQNCQVI